MTPHDRLERSTWDLFWLPPGARVIDRPELLAIGIDREVGYLNCVYRTRASASALPGLVDEVIALHGAQTSRWSVVDTVDTAPIVQALERGGYQRDNVHDARIAAVDEFVPRPAPDVEVRRIEDEQTLRDGWQVMDGAFERTTPHTDDDVQIELEACARPDSRIHRFVAYLDGEPVGSAGLNVFPDLGIGLLWGGGTVPHARGRGVYSALVAQRVARAKAAGIGHVGLYARTATSSPIVERQGFARHGTMTYFTRAPKKPGG